jgi:hypothetical protein
MGLLAGDVMLSSCTSYKASKQKFEITEWFIPQTLQALTQAQTFSELRSRELLPLLVYSMLNPRKASRWQHPEKYLLRQFRSFSPVNEGIESGAILTSQRSVAWKAP